MYERDRPRERPGYRSGHVVNEMTSRSPVEWNVRAGKDDERARKDPGS